MAMVFGLTLSEEKEVVVAAVAQPHYQVCYTSGKKKYQLPVGEAGDAEVLIHATFSRRKEATQQHQFKLSQQ